MSGVGPPTSCLPDKRSPTELHPHYKIAKKACYFSIIIEGNYRIVFHAIPPEIPHGEHGEMLLEQIKEIKIIEIVDYHG